MYFYTNCILSEKFSKLLYFHIFYTYNLQPTKSFSTRQTFCDGAVYGLPLNNLIKIICFDPLQLRLSSGRGSKQLI